LSHTFEYTFNSQITEGPTVDVAGSFDIDAYEEIEVAVPADNRTAPARIRGASTAQVVVITSSDYQQLEYHVGDPQRVVQLDRPHILTGAGLIARMGLASGTLYFRKGGGDDAMVRIVVGTRDDRERSSHDLGSTEIEPQRVEGGGYPAADFDLEARLNQAEEDKPFYVPRGPERGEIVPTNPELPVKEMEPDGENGDAQAPLRFEEYDETDDASRTAHASVPEPSVAENGETVMTTGNFWVALSLDAGKTFTTMNPTTIFPQDYGGFCCDQVLQYVPEFDLFVWLLQYRQDGDGVNAIRIAVQDTQGVRNSGGTAWTYWDFRNTVFASSGMLDYNDMSFGNTFLYWTSSVGGGANRYVVRVPLAQLSARGTVNFQYTSSTDAYWSHVTQNGQDGVYWAGHVNNSTLKVYSMMDADGFYSWREVPINSWPNNTMTSTAANGADWLMDASWKTYVRAAAVHRDSAYFAWNASSGGGFPEPHIQIARINTNTFKLEDQMQIWNPEFAFAYPYFDTNVEGQLGMIVAFGGGPFDSSSGVGVWGDFVIYYPRLSSSSATNYGHYHTVRRAASNGMQWVGAGYIREADNTIVPYYVRFSR
jgi:hypothetical protein